MPFDFLSSSFEFNPALTEEQKVTQSLCGFLLNCDVMSVLGFND